MTDKRAELFSTGRWTGTYGVLPLQHVDAANLLHRRLKLADQDMTPSGTHPVYLMLGRQSDVSGGLPGFRSFGITYNEAMILVPHVRLDGGKRDFLYMPRLFLNSSYASWLGQYFFHFDKVRKEVECGATHFQVHEGGRTSKPLLHATIEPVTRYEADDVAVGHAKLTSIFSQPLIGLRDTWCGSSAMVSWMTFSNFLCVPAEMNVKVYRNMLDRKRLEGAYHLTGLDRDVAGKAAHLVSDWTLSYATSQFDR